MATYADDYLGLGSRTSTGMVAPPRPSTGQLYGGGGGGSWGEPSASAGPTYGPAYPGPAPITTPTAPSAPGTSRTAVASAVGQRAAPMAAPAPIQPIVGQVTPGLQGIQAGLQSAAGVPSYVDPNLTQDAFAGNLAMALARRQQPAGYTTAPAGVNYSPTYEAPAPRGPLTNEERLAAYRPEVVQGMYGGNEYATTSAGLEAPNPANFASMADYNKAQDTFNRLSLMEQETEANSAARQYADVRRAEQEGVLEMRRRTQAADAAQAEIRKKNSLERQALMTRLAARGISPETDSWAMQKMGELDTMDRQEQQAAAQIAQIDASTLQTQASAQARKELADRLAQIAVAKGKLAKASATESKSAFDLIMGEAKKEELESRVTYRQSEAERKAIETGLKEAAAPGIVERTAAQTGKLGAETGFISGAKTKLTEAKTAEILALTPAKKAKLEADVKKALARGTGRAGGGVAGANLSKQFFSDTSRLVDDLAGGQRSWGSAFDTARAIYPNVPDTVLDTALGKEQWAEPGAYEARKSKAGTSGGSALDNL